MFFLGSHDNCMDASVAVKVRWPSLAFDDVTGMTFKYGLSVVRVNLETAKRVIKNNVDYSWFHFVDDCASKI